MILNQDAAALKTSRGAANLFSIKKGCRESKKIENYCTNGLQRITSKNYNFIARLVAKLYLLRTTELNNIKAYLVMTIQQINHYYTRGQQHKQIKMFFFVC